MKDLIHDVQNEYPDASLRRMQLNNSISGSSVYLVDCLTGYDNYWICRINLEHLQDDCGCMEISRTKVSVLASILISISHFKNRVSSMTFFMFKTVIFASKFQKTTFNCSTSNRPCAKCLVDM